MRSKSIATSCLSLLLLVLAAPLAAQRDTPTPSERRAQLQAAYQAALADPELQRLEDGLAGNHDNAAYVDRYLQRMPLSPMELLEIDMRARHYEFGIPRFIAEWHARWIQLHETDARTLYGDDYVDAKKAGWPAYTGEDALSPSKATVDTNRNVAATASPSPLDYQGEIQVGVNPNNANQVVAAANTWDTIGGSCAGGIQAVFYSSDGGDSWDYTCPPLHTAYSLGSCSGTVFGSDPAVAWNDDDEVFLNHMMICYINSSNVQYAMVVARSTNGGASWNAQGVIRNSWGSTTLEDKNFYVVDNTPTSSFYGRHYTCWDRNNNEKMAYSTNNGASWTEVDLPTSSGNGSGSRFDLGCDLAVGSDGTVHVVFNTLSCLSSCNNEEMFYTRSTNGGVSWSTPVEVRDFNLVAFSSNSCPDAQNSRCIGPFGGIAVDASGGSCDGTLYATFGDFTSGNGNNSDVWIARSTNNGASWSSPILVNDDGISNRAQFHSFVQVDQSNGDVVVAWHDARNDSGNDAVDYFVARSTDCGLNFEANVQVSQPSSEFNNSGISYSNENTSDNTNYNPNQYGEYLGLDVLDGKAYVAWTDTRHFFPGSSSNSQAENLGFAVVEFGAGAVCGNGVLESPEECDDGNTTGGDGCSATCTIEPVCGNNVIEGSEVCDGTDLDGETCSSQGFGGGGTLACNGSCTAFDTSSCVAGNDPAILMSFRSNTSVPGVGTVADEDVVSYDEGSGTWAFEFDGSDVGLSSFEISGLAVLPGGDLLLSFTTGGSVGGVSFDDSDILRFTPTSLGTTTAGSFSMYFDGSDVGLSSNNEDIDAIALASDGRLIISTTGSASVSGASAADEDLLIFTGTLGSSTSGSFALYFDGSDVGLTSSSEDLDGAALTASGDLIFSTLGNFSASGASGADEDVAQFTGTFGSSTSGSISVRLDLSTLGISSSEDIGGLFIIE